jgi:hypothetical protein
MSGSIATPLTFGSPSLTTSWGAPWPAASPMMASGPSGSYWEAPWASNPVDPARTAPRDDLSGHLGGIVAGLGVQALIAGTGLPPRIPGVEAFWPDYGGIALIAAVVIAVAFGCVGLSSLTLFAGAVVVLTFVVMPLVGWTFGAGIAVRSVGGINAEAGIGVAIAQLFLALAFFGLSGILFSWRAPAGAA